MFESRRLVQFQRKNTQQLQKKKENPKAKGIINDQISLVEFSKFDFSMSRFICHCSKSKCLKLYCECFRRGEYCHPACQCNNCCNREEFQDQRQKAVRIALDRNEDAFKVKIRHKIKVLAAFSQKLPNQESVKREKEST